jgi:hypothetical protein
MIAGRPTPAESSAAGWGPTLSTKTASHPSGKGLFLVVWWMSKNPYAAVFENRIAAEAAANVRNAILVTFKGNNAKVEAVVDWYRRDEEGRPMPAEWRELMGQLRVPWSSKPKSTSNEIETVSASEPAAAEA